MDEENRTNKTKGQLQEGGDFTLNGNAEFKWKTCIFFFMHLLLVNY